MGYTTFFRNVSFESVLWQDPGVRRELFVVRGCDEDQTDGPSPAGGAEVKSAADEVERLIGGVKGEHNEKLGVEGENDKKLVVEDEKLLELACGPVEADLAAPSEDSVPKAAAPELIVDCGSSGSGGGSRGPE